MQYVTSRRLHPASGLKRIYVEKKNNNKEKKLSVPCALYPFCTITGKKNLPEKKNQYIAVLTHNFMQSSFIQKCLRIEGL